MLYNFSIHESTILNLFLISFYEWDVFCNWKAIFRKIKIENFFNVIIFDISIWVLLYIIYKIKDDICYNSRESKIGRFKVFKFLNNLKQNDQLKEYEDFCISLNNKQIVEKIQIYLCLDYNDVHNLVKNKELDKIKECLKNSGISEWKNTYKKIEKLMLYYDTPTDLNIFIDYYNKTLLQNKNNIFSLLTGFISFIISVVSLLGISSFLSISFEFYLWYMFPVVYSLYQIVLYYKKDKQSTYTYYKDLLEKFNEQYILYKNNKT